VKLIQNVEVVELFADPVECIGPDLLGPDVLQDSLSLLRIVPEIGLVGDTLLVFYFRPLAVVVKDTSSRRRYDLLDL